MHWNGGGFTFLFIGIELMAITSMILNKYSSIKYKTNFGVADGIKKLT
jgi:hypothetical protein